MHIEHRLTKLTERQQAAVREHCAKHPPIYVGKPTTKPQRPPFYTRALNRFIDWYSNLI